MQIRDNNDHRIYKGVYKVPAGAFAAQIRDQHRKGKTIYIGTSPTAKEAALAHDKSARSAFGKEAVCNFPEHNWAAPDAKEPYLSHATCDED